MFLLAESFDRDVFREQEPLSGRIEEVTPLSTSPSDVRLVYLGAAAVALLLVGYLLKQRRENP